MNNTIKKEENPSKLNYYWLIAFFLFFFTDLSKSYFDCIKIIKPLILSVILFTMMVYEISDGCGFEELPLIEIANRSILLLSVFLYSEYTVKCIPVFNLTISSLFQYPLFGSMLKTCISFVLMYACNYIMNTYGNTTNEKSLCTIKNSNTHLVYSISILGIILLNSYLEYI
jgi:hypothetical protein